MATGPKSLPSEEYATLPDRHEDFGQNLNDELAEGENTFDVAIG